MGKLSARLKLGAVGVSALALTAGGLLATAGVASAATVPVQGTPVATNFVSLPFGPGGGPAHTLAMDVLGQNHSPGAQVVSWQSDEYQNVNGRVDPAEQWDIVPVSVTVGTHTVSLTKGAGKTGVYQLEWAPGGVASGNCLEDQSTAEHTHAVMEPCANGSFTVAYTGPGNATVTGSVYQDFIYDQTSDNTNDLANSGYGELKPVIGNIELTPVGGSSTSFTIASPYIASHQTALNDSAWANGGHVISWHANSANNEEWNTTRSAG